MGELLQDSRKVVLGVLAAVGVMMPSPALAESGVENGGQCHQAIAQTFHNSFVRMNEVQVANSPANGTFNATQTPGGEVHSAPVAPGTQRCAV